MRFSISLRSGVMASLAVLCALTNSLAQDAPAPNSASKNATAPSLQPAGAQMVAVEFHLIDFPSEAVGANGQEGDLTPAKVAELVKASKAIAVSRLKLNALVGMPTEVSFGERVSTVVGRTVGPRGGGGGFGEATNIQFENLGFMASVVPTVLMDKSVQLEVTFERSRVAPTHTPPAPPAPPAPPPAPTTPTPFVPPPKHDQIRIKSHVSVKPNEPALLAARTVGGNDGVTTVVLVSASVPTP